MIVGSRRSFVAYLVTDTFLWLCIANFENYAKGPKFNECTQDMLGHGIFNANGEQWKWQRKAASLIFNVKNFRDHFTE